MPYLSVSFKLSRYLSRVNNSYSPLGKRIQFQNMPRLYKPHWVKSGPYQCLHKTLILTWKKWKKNGFENLHFVISKHVHLIHIHSVQSNYEALIEKACPDTELFGGHYRQIYADTKGIEKNVFFQDIKTFGLIW